MKWSDLSFKEKKQIYDSIKAQNPDTTYLDIKSQFDSIPAYEDGGKKIMPPKELGLTPGTPEYYKRQQQISGKASTVQPEAYITPAGYVKDAINFVEDLSNGDYTGAAVDAALNIIPWGVGKTLKKFKSKVGRLIEGTDEYATSSYAEPFTPTITKPIKAKRTPSGERNYNPAKPPKDIEAQAAMLQDTWYREAVNKNRYLADPDNTYTTKELRDAGFHSAARNKRYIDRLNRLVPMEWLLPTIGLGGAEFLREKQNNKSN